MANEKHGLTYRPANSTREYRELRDNPKVPIIRNRDDWRAYLASKDSVLKNVPKEAVEKFTESLVLNDGLGAFKYDMLQDRLTFKQFRDLLGRFGIDFGILTDYDDYYCSGRGTCSKQATSICLGDRC